MTPLNGILAFGALAFTIPLVIHLFFRSKFRTLPWGAMHLLDSVVRINRRRIQLLNLLLLLLRCLIPVLLAFCLARPVLTGFRALPGDAPRSLILAIDDSRSTQMAGSNGRTRWQTSRSAANALLDSLSRRDEVMIVRASRRGELVGTMSVPDAQRAIAEMGTPKDPIDNASVRIGRLLRAAIDASEDASHAQKQIVVISDFQSHEVDETALKTLRQTGQSLSGDPLRPDIRFLSVAGLTDGSNSMGNLSVDQITTDAAAVVAGRKSRFSARIYNHGDNDSGAVRLLWNVGGKVQRPRTIRVPPKSSAVSRLTIAIDDVGVQPVSVTIEHADALSADNERFMGVDVIKEVRVLIVDGNPSRKAFAGESDFLAIALSPFAFGGEDQPDAVRSEVVTVNQMAKKLADKTPAKKFDVLVLAGIAAPTEDQKNAVAKFVAGGGNIMVLPTEKMKPEAYAGKWGTEEHSYRLPMTYAAMKGSVDADAETTFPVGKRNGAYSPWNLLGDADDDLFGDLEVTAHHAMTPGTAASPDREGSGADTFSDDELNADSSAPSNAPTGAMTLLALSDGEPLVTYGKMTAVGETPMPSGRIVQFGIPATAKGSALPLRPLFLPMMQQLILDLAGSQRQTTYEIGEPFTIPLDEIGGERSAEQLASDQYVIRPPGSDDPTLSRSTDAIKVRPIGLDPDANETIETAQIAVPLTTRRGVYSFDRNSIGESAQQADNPPNKQSTIRVVEVPPIESDARVTPTERLASAAELIDAKVYSDVGSLLSDDRTNRFGREIWHWLLMAMLVFMIGELFLQQRLTNPTKQRAVKADVGSWTDGDSASGNPAGRTGSGTVAGVAT